MSKYTLPRLVVIFLTTCLLLWSCHRAGNKAKTLPEQAIKEVLDLQVKQWNEGNVEGFMQGYERSDSLQFITSRGRTTGWSNVLDLYRKHYPTRKEMGNLAFRNLLLKSLSDSVVQVYGNWEVQKDTVMSGNFSLIMKNGKEGWRIIIDHTW